MRKGHILFRLESQKYNVLFFKLVSFMMTSVIKRCKQKTKNLSSFGSHSQKGHFETVFIEKCSEKRKKKQLEK